MNMEYTKSSTKQNNDDPITSSNDLLGFLPPSTSNNGGEDTTLVSEECEGESHCSASTSSVLTKTDSRSVADAEIWELLSSTRSNTGGAEHDDDDDLDDDGSESDCSFFKISPSSSPTMNKKEEIECEIGVVDKDVLDILVLGDSDSFRLLSTKPSSEHQKEQAATTTSRKRSFFHDGAAGGDEDMDDKLRQLHEKRARLEASLFSSPRPDQQQQYALQELRRKRPVCLFVNFLGTRRPQEDTKSSSSTTTRTMASITTTETRVSSLQVSECPQSEPSDLPTKKSASLITTVSKKLDAPPSHNLVTPEGLKMLEALGLSICPCKMKMMNKKKHSRTMSSFQASKDPSLSSGCFPALPFLAAAPTLEW